MGSTKISVLSHLGPWVSKAQEKTPLKHQGLTQLPSEFFLVCNYLVEAMERAGTGIYDAWGISQVSVWLLWSVAVE